MSGNDYKSKNRQDEPEKPLSPAEAKYYKEKLVLFVLMVAFGTILLISIVSTVVLTMRQNGNIAPITMGIIGILSLIALVIVFSVMRSRKAALTNYYETSNPDLDEAFNAAERKYVKNNKRLTVYLIIFITLCIISALTMIITSFNVDSEAGLIAILTSGISALISILAIVIILTLARNVARSACNSDKVVALLLEERKERMLEKNNEKLDD